MQDLVPRARQVRIHRRILMSLHLGSIYGAETLRTRDLRALVAAATERERTKAVRSMANRIYPGSPRFGRFLGEELFKHLDAADGTPVELRGDGQGFYKFLTKLERDRLIVKAMGKRRGEWEINPAWTLPGILAEKATHIRRISERPPLGPKEDPTAFLASKLARQPHRSANTVLASSGLEPRPDERPMLKAVGNLLAMCATLVAALPSQREARVYLISMTADQKRVRRLPTLEPRSREAMAVAEVIQRAVEALGRKFQP